jgi:hypothetical protein
VIFPLNLQTAKFAVQMFLNHIRIRSICNNFFPSEVSISSLFIKFRNYERNSYLSCGMYLKTLVCQKENFVLVLHLLAFHTFP